MQSGLRTQKTITTTAHSHAQQADIARSDAISGLLVILIPVFVYCTIVGYRKYRTTLVQRHIQHLNRLWELDSSKKLS